jgi:hypothetical protein
MARLAQSLSVLRGKVMKSREVLLAGPASSAMASTKNKYDKCVANGGIE